MKSLLKFLILPVFVLVPSMTVIACGGTNQQVSDQDILNSATGQMQDHTFKMKENLDLNLLPVNGDNYNDDSLWSTRERIESYYRELVKTGMNWDYPTVAVKITSDATAPSFINKYGPSVEARITLIAHLEYKNLKEDKNVVVKISNDITDQQVKIDAIGTYLTNYLNDNNPTFEFKSLLKDGLKNTDSDFIYDRGKIQADLRTALFTTNSTTPIPVIDVEGVDLSVQSSDPATESQVYLLDNQNLVTTETVTGIIQNLTLSISYNTGFSHQIKLGDLTSQNLKFAQSISDVNNQIANILSQGNQGFQFNKSDLVGANLPTDNQMFSDYDQGSAFTTTVTEKMFNYIAVIYPSAKMDSTNWKANLIKVDNASASPYIVIDDHHGYFTVNVSFTYTSGDIKIETSVFEIQLNLNDL